MLEEVEAEFGVDRLVAREYVLPEAKEAKRVSTYNSEDVAGLTVGHSASRIQGEVVLTLKDRQVLDDEEDVLQSLEMLDAERGELNQKNKAAKPKYAPVDDSHFDPENAVRFLL